MAKNTPAAAPDGRAQNEATQKDALSLHKTALIGVFGTNTRKFALIRLSSGAIRKVKVGDRVNWGQVTAIGQSRLMIRRNGKDIVLGLPSG